jgi:thiol-disulfide isomerase/thioredoxin
MPDFDAAYKKYGNDIHFLMVNLTDGAYETVSSASAFIQQKGYSFPVYYDTSEQAAYTYGTGSIPVTYFIDARGVLAAYGSGALDAETLEIGISYIYSK